MVRRQGRRPVLGRDTLTQCAQPINYYRSGDLTAASGDCNDLDAALNPGTTWYADRDGDMYSNGEHAEPVRPTP